MQAIFQAGSGALSIHLLSCKSISSICHPQGECDRNPGWMIINCPHSCSACHLRDPKLRCDRERLNISTEPVYKNGDMAAMFASIQERFGERYGVNVLSTDPYVVTFDNFLNDDEVQPLISIQNSSKSQIFLTYLYNFFLIYVRRWRPSSRRRPAGSGLQTPAPQMNTARPGASFRRAAHPATAGASTSASPTRLCRAPSPR